MGMDFDLGMKRENLVDDKRNQAVGDSHGGKNHS